MLQKFIPTLLLASAAVALPSLATLPFRPDDHSTWENSRVPARYSLSEDQSNSGSFWYCTFVTTTDGGQYIALQHVLGSAYTQSRCKSSIFNVETREYWNDFDYCTPSNATADANATISVDFGNYGIHSTAEDKISSMSIYGKSSNYSYDFSFEARSKVLLNGGNGVITFGAGYSNSTEWAIPAMRASGSLTIGENVLTVAPEQSFGWYDRQAGFGAPANWTWFQLHFPGSSIKASIWAYDLVAPAAPTTNRFATVRVGEESQFVLAYDLKANWENTWTSDKTNYTYPQSWQLVFENGDCLEVESLRPDQEIYGPNAIGDSVYAGIISGRGSFLGQRTAYGLVEMITISA